MANRRQKKKNAKKAGTWDGGQYRGGRPEGRKNLKRTEAGLLRNQHGVEFTEDEKKALVNAVNKVNYKRKKMLKEAATLPRRVGGRDTGDTIGSLQLMGKESDFILAKKTKSLQRFKSRDQYDKYMKRLEIVNSKDYLTERIRGYKRNYTKALYDVFGDQAKDVAMKIRMMKPEDYMKMVQSNEDLEIGYIYDASDASAKLNQIRAALGMKLKEDDFFDGDEY